MKHIICVEKNKEGIIQLTLEQLEKMLNEAYDDGYKDRSLASVSYTTNSTPGYTNIRNANLVSDTKYCEGVISNQSSDIL